MCVSTQKALTSFFAETLQRVQMTPLSIKPDLPLAVSLATTYFVAMCAANEMGGNGTRAMYLGGS